MQIESRVVLITGASEGIGAACARLLGSRGAKLALLSRSENKMRTVARQGDLMLPIDLTDEGERSNAVQRVVERFGRIDILINNAGVGPRTFSPQPSSMYDAANST
ncbi:MAG: SDR family NAD(P)-dependent oxidoreductase [Bryobacteraceae bacterium]